MPAGREALMSYIRQLATLPNAEQASDATLLGRFVAGRDEQAFTALMKRHGAMVHQVCWRILGDGVQAEDAFQATFLVLARKASSVQPREALPAWLHGVARRVAIKARAARLRHHETGPLPEIPADKRADPLAQISARELLTIIDEEIQRLPERYRLPLVLCCLSGRSLEEAASQLGWTSGSVKGRLERGRARLHDRLVRRGLTLSAVLAAVELSRATSSAAVLARLIARTVPGALAFGEGQIVVTSVSSSAAALASRVVVTLAVPRLTMAVALLITTVLLGAGIAYRLQSPEHEGRAQEFAPPADLVTLPKPVQSQPAQFWDQSDVPMEVGGRVLDPRGNPVAGAELYVGYSERRLIRRTMPENTLAEQPRPGSYPRRATTGADGRFHFRFATAELDPRLLDDARPAVMAVAAGYGPNWVELKPSASGDLNLQLVQDAPVSGRVLDEAQNPVAGASLSLQALYSAPVNDLTRFLGGKDDNAWAPRCWKGPLPGKALAILTGADGRWQCSGLGRDRIAAFALAGSRVPHTLLNIANRPVEQVTWWLHVHGPSFDYQMPPVQIIRGSVRDRATGEPLAGISVANIVGKSRVRTGPDGMFEIVSYSQKGHGLVAQPEAGQGYFASQNHVHGDGAADELTLDLFLQRGITLSGKVTDSSTGKPPKSAVVEYYPLSSNQNSREVNCTNLLPASTGTVRPDGSYSLVVLPGPGFIGVVAAPREHYAAADRTNKEWVEFLRQQRPRLSRFSLSEADSFVSVSIGGGQQGALPINKFHTLALVDPPQGALAVDLDLPLRIAQTIQGTVLGPDGRPLDGVEVVGLSELREARETLEGATFTVTGMHPQGSRELVFQHRLKNLGRVVTVRGNATEPVTVQLEPCGTVHGRFVDELGNPLPAAYVVFSEDASVGYVSAKTDVLGRFQMTLLPGQKYSWGDPRPLTKDLGTIQVGSGQIRDLGDLVQKQPTRRPKIPERIP